MEGSGVTGYVVAKVVVDVPSRSVDRFFDYLVPASYEEQIDPCLRWVVSFRTRFC